MYGKFGLLSLKKVSNHSTALPSFLFFVFLFSYFRATDCEAYSFTTDGYMRSLTCAQIWVRAVHTKEGQAQTSLHKSWLGGTEKLPLALPGTPLRYLHSDTSTPVYSTLIPPLHSDTSTPLWYLHSDTSTPVQKPFPYTVKRRAAWPSLGLR